MEQKQLIMSQLSRKKCRMSWQCYPKLLPTESVDYVIEGIKSISSVIQILRPYFPPKWRYLQYDVTFGRLVTLLALLFHLIFILHLPGYRNLKRSVMKSRYKEVEIKLHSHSGAARQPSEREWFFLSLYFSFSLSLCLCAHYEFKPKSGRTFWKTNFDNVHAKRVIWVQGNV